MNNILIRQMKDTDIDDVMVIERASYTSPWQAKVLVRELHKNDYAHYFVLIYEGKIVGYAGLWVVIDDAQVTTIAIDPNYRRRGFGDKLFHYLIHYAMSKGVKRFSLEVRVSNIAAQKLYRKYGLVPGGIRKKYYEDNQEDALIMWVNL